MHDLAVRQARSLLEALKALGIEGARILPRALPPDSERNRLDRANTWEVWAMILRVRWQEREVWVEHAWSTPFVPETTARCIKRVFDGSMDSEGYRYDRLRERVMPDFIGVRSYITRTRNAELAPIRYEDHALELYKPNLD